MTTDDREPLRYRYYGLVVQSNVVLPGLPPAARGPANVVLEFVREEACPVVGAPWVMLDPPRTAWRAPGEAGSRLRLQFHGRGEEWVEFVIEDGGGRVRIALGEHVELGEVVELLLGSVFSCVLAQVGATCLHASAVVLEDHAFAFVGPSRAGKSTLALALVQQGARLVADDVAALWERDGVIAVAAGLPRLRLHEDSADALTGAFKSLRPVWAEAISRPPKRYYEVDEDVPVPALRDVPLAAVFLLGPRGGTHVRIRAVAAGELMPRLMADRHMAALQDRAGHRRDFACLASVARRLPGRELLRPDDLRMAPVVAETVLAEAEGLAVLARQSRGT